MKIAMCDDDRIFHGTLERLTEQYELSRNIIICMRHFNSGDAVPEINDFDIIFMDYEMRGVNGIETARRLRAANSDAVIIFVSAYLEAAPDSFEVNAFRFLKKPVDKDKLFKALDDYLAFSERCGILSFRLEDAEIKVKTSDIVYLEGNRGHTTVRTNRDVFYVGENIAQLAARLPNEKFVRCHKAFVASLANVKNHSATEIVFFNGEKAAIGRRYSKSFKTALQNYVMRYNEGLYQ
ncbi:MAG: LytTR family DNA-binding domain-containing protein [Bacteroides sp.]|nr:LytTR family DNA-binding domain-containing protein [Bacteroides sp.]